MQKLIEERGILLQVNDSKLNRHRNRNRYHHGLLFSVHLENVSVTHSHVIVLATRRHLRGTSGIQGDSAASEELKTGRKTADCCQVTWHGRLQSVGVRYTRFASCEKRRLAAECRLSHVNEAFVRLSCTRPRERDRPPYTVVRTKFSSPHILPYVSSPYPPSWTDFISNSAWLNRSQQGT